MAGLTTRQKVFIEAYLANGFNATKAARTAGYSGDDNALAVRGSETVRNSKVKALIDERIKEMAMTADEALARLSMTARGDLSEYLGLSVAELKTHPRAQLLHKVEVIRRTLPPKDKDSKPEIEERVKLELYDAQAAQLAILKEQHLRAGEATDRLDIDDSKATDARQQLERALARLAERNGQDEGSQQSDE